MSDLVEHLVARFKEMERTADLERQYELHRDALLDLVISWDLKDAGDRPIPFTPEAVRSEVSGPLTVALVQGVIADVKARVARAKAERGMA